jgi:hypothetical protein
MSAELIFPSPPGIAVYCLHNEAVEVVRIRRAPLNGP